MYYDELAISIGLIEHPMNRDSKQFEVVALLPGGETPADDVASSVEGVAGGHPFVISTKLNHTSWGADATLLSVAIDIGVGLGSAGVYDAIRKLIAKFPGYLGREDERSYDDHEMIQAAQRILHRTSPEESFEPSSIERQPGTSNVAIVSYRDSQHKETKLRITMYEGVPIGERIYREL